MHWRKEMKRIHINLINTRENDIEIISKFMELIENTDGITIDTFSIESVSDEDFKNMTIKY